MFTETAIKLDNVSMRFHMIHERVDSLKEYAIKIIKHQLTYQEFWALNQISFEINKGEVFGLLGLNGAGKSTLLKLVAGVLKPTKGTVTVNGTISPLIELGAGFDPDLSAKENVFLNGAVLGYSAKQMKAKYHEIMDFAELWEFEDVPIKNFSSGMYARLGFSIATTIEPEILIVDEILGVGDFKFQEKCTDRIHTLMEGGTTVLMVSHSISIIKKYCERAAWLDKGSLVDIGPSLEVCHKYEKQ